MKKILILIIFIASSCNTNVAYVTKNIYIIDSDNSQAYQSGSKLDDVLKGNSQKADGKIADEIKGQ